MGPTLYSFSDKTMGKRNLQAQTQNSHIIAIFQWTSDAGSTINSKALHGGEQLLGKFTAYILDIMVRGIVLSSC